MVSVGDSDPVVPSVDQWSVLVSPRVSPYLKTDPTHVTPMVDPRQFEFLLLTGALNVVSLL